MSEEEKPDASESEESASPENASSVDDGVAGGDGAKAAVGDDGEALLSDDEIGALLEGVSQDEVGSEPVGPCQVVDLADRGGSGFKMAGLDRINAKFALQLRNGLYTFLRHRVDVSYEGTSCPTFEEYLDSCGEPTSFNLVRLDPLPGQSIVALSADLLYRAVDTLFGGTGADARAESMVEFTATEIRVAQSLVDVAMHDLARAWKDVQPLKGSVLSQESNPRMVVITERSERVVVSAFKLALEGAGQGHFSLAMPLVTFEPVRDALVSDIQDGTDVNASPDWARDFRRELMAAQTNVVARLATVDTTVRKLGKLQVGDVLPINEPDQVDLLVEGALFLQGRYGEARGNVVARIDTVADRVLELNPSKPTRIGILDVDVAAEQSMTDGK